ILANAGGVVTSYFEWVQDLQNFFWKEIEVNDRLDDIMRYAYQAVHKKMLQYKVDMRTAALIIAVERVAHATTTRGIFP
ncbi:Glu/Leu/Phe/Val dehydrogenase, partial [Acinetobacter baumannii]